MKAAHNTKDIQQWSEGVYRNMPRRSLWIIVRSKCEEYAYAATHGFAYFPAKLLLDSVAIQVWIHRHGPRKLNNAIRYHRQYYRRGGCVKF